MRYFVTSPWWLRLIYPKGLTWKIPEKDNVLYLTFDDGPHPEATPYVLDLLKQYQAKATFFCIGKNVVENPAIYQRILAEGHKVGNHTHNHLNNWKVKPEEWLQNVKEAAQWIDSDLLRPPYGRITYFSAKVLQDSKPPYRIIMWDVLSADFDPSLSGEKCGKIVQKNARKGSVIVFHDSEKALPRMKIALADTLSYFSDKGFIFKVIE